MKWTIDYISGENYFRIKDDGIYEPGDIENLYRDLLSHPSWKPGSAMLRDMRLLDFRNVTYSIISKAVNAVARDNERFGAARIAYLVDSDVGFGVCRQLQMLMEANMSLQIEVFREETAALEWLAYRRGVGAEQKTTNLF